MTGFTLPAAISGQTFLFDGARDRGLFVHRARTQARAGVPQPLHQQRAEIDQELGRALERDLHDAAVHRGGLVVLLDVLARHHVDDQLGALVGGRLLGLGDEILRVVIDRDVRAELAAGLGLFLASRP